MAQYKTKAQTIEAFQIKINTPTVDLIDWVEGFKQRFTDHFRVTDEDELKVITFNGDLIKINTGDYIVKDKFTGSYTVINGSSFEKDHKPIN